MDPPSVERDKWLRGNRIVLRSSASVAAAAEIGTRLLNSPFGSFSRAVQSSLGQI